MVDSKSVSEYLTYMCAHGKGDYTFAELETKFGLERYNEPGNRAKKLWYSFNDTGCSIDEFVSNNTLPVVTSETDVSNTKTEWTYNNDNAYFAGNTDKPITNLDEALSFCKVDLSVWEVERWQLKTWDTSAKVKSGNDTVIQTKTNYGVHVWFKRKITEQSVEFDNLMSYLRESFERTAVPYVVPSRGVGVVNMADFHIGADITDLIRTPDFNVDILVGHLDRIASIINNYGFSEVHINFLGDYFESISGLNHLNTFKSLGRGMYGAKVIKVAVMVLSEFLKKINNLHSVNIISGNHDRVTMSNVVDNEGAAAEVLAFCLELIFGDAVKIDYHTYLISKDIDGICYLLTHGHFSMDKKDPAKIVKQYGSPDLYTLWLSGHVHTRKTDRFMQRRPISYETISAVSLDEANYRKVVVPSLFTGNFYSETLGYTSCGGFIIVENNGSGKPNVYDFSI